MPLTSHRWSRPRRWRRSRWRRSRSSCRLQRLRGCAATAPQPARSDCSPRCRSPSLLAAWLGFGALAGDVTGENFVDTLVGALGTWSLWVTVIVFFLSFWLLGAIINRGRWGAWVIFGLLVGFASYGGHLLGQLFQAPFWTLTASEGAQLVEDQLTRRWRSRHS